jgi:type III restriction enzyme
LFLDKDTRDGIIHCQLSYLHIKDASEVNVIRAFMHRASYFFVEKKTLEFENAEFCLSQTKPFSWRRDLQKGPCECKKTVFNYVTTYNDFERRFAVFLDSAKDVIRFSSLGTTEQGDSATKFRVDYLKPSGAIGFYHPDWVILQKEGKTEVNWIIETKGRVWEDTLSKDDAIKDWCARMSHLSGNVWKFERVNQVDFQAIKAIMLSDLLAQPEGEV